MICIYKITNIITNNIYIGSSAQYKKRIDQHFYKLKYNKHHSSYLQNSYNKHGLLAFRAEIIEDLSYLNNLDKNEINVKMVKREQYYIDSLCPKYNMNKKAQSILGKTNCKAETIEKIRIKNTGRKNTRESKLKMSKARTGKIRVIGQYDIDNNLINTFNLLSETSEITGIPVNSVKNSLYGVCKTTRGFTFKFLD